MWRWILLAAALSALSPAQAVAQYGYRHGGSRLEQGSQQGDAPGRQGRRQQEAERRQPDRDRRETLTPDERRELNRDLQRANREIYRKGRNNR